MANGPIARSHIHAGSNRSIQAHAAAWMHMRYDDAVIEALRRDGMTSIRLQIQRAPIGRGGGGRWWGGGGMISPHPHPTTTHIET